MLGGHLKNYPKNDQPGQLKERPGFLVSRSLTLPVAPP